MTIKEQFTNLATKAQNNIGKMPFKKFAAGAIAGIMLMGSGFCLANEYKDFHKEHDSAAYIQTQAAEKNIKLIDEDKVKNITAKAIGVKESNIEFHKIHLKNYQGKISTEFKPVYKVKCFANGVKYSLRVDAVSGEVLKDYDKDQFHHRGDRMPPQQPDQQNQ